MNHDWYEDILSLKEQFHTLKAEMDLLHQAWQIAVRERDFARQSSLIAQEGDLIRDAAEVISAFQHLIAQDMEHLLETCPSSRRVDTPAWCLSVTVEAKPLR